MTLHCPRCPDATLTPPLEGAPMWACPSCGGQWLSRRAAKSLKQGMSALLRAALELAQHRGETPFADGGDSPPVNCPRCAKGCRRVSVGGVDVDWCPDHGNWYDAGELLTVAQHLRASTQGQSLDEMRENLFAEWTRVEKSDSMWEEGDEPGPLNALFGWMADAWSDPQDKADETD